MDYEDEIPQGKRRVRSFMATGGRASTTAELLPLETMVSAAPVGHRFPLQFEQAQVVEIAATTQSIAELTAALNLPIRAGQILISELVNDGYLTAAKRIETNQVSSELLLRMRSRILSL